MYIVYAGGGEATTVCVPGVRVNGSVCVSKAAVVQVGGERIMGRVVRVQRICASIMELVCRVKVASCDERAALYCGATELVKPLL